MDPTATGVRDGSNQDVFTARGRESPPQERRKGECEITVTTSTPDGIRTRPGVGEPRAAAWRGWTGSGEEAQRACTWALGQGSREAARLEGPQRARRDGGPGAGVGGEPLARPGGLTA